MLRISIFVAILAASSVYCADKETFKNCSRIDFCTRLRAKTLDSNAQFTADITSLEVNDNVASIPLSNSNNENLVLQISLLSGHKARVKVLETSHSRYELADVLDGEPTVISFSMVNLANKSLSLFPKDEPDKSKIIVKPGPPFAVEFYYDDQLEIVMNAKRLLLENTNSSQAYSFDVEFASADKLYGLYHHASKLALTETADGTSDPFRLRNSDLANYEVNSPMALYGAVPVVYGHSALGTTSGVFLHNAAEQWVDISYKESRPSAYFMVESGTLDLFIMFGPTSKEVVRQFTSLTGVAHLPQLWTLGYHQCRWNYYTQEDVKYVVAMMDANDFPMDAIWLDIDYTDGRRYFTWNGNFSDPIEMQQNISSTDRKLVVISDPHIKVDEDYPVYTGGKEFYVKWKNGTNFEGDCWPGLSSYIDFLNPKARDYYASWYGYDKFTGTTETLAGIWNDMNEPSVFDNSLEKTLPFETLHYGDVLHRDIHNIYGMLQTMATHQGLMQRDNGTKRPFILTRSHFAGSQRYAAMWTGDNTADWSYLQTSYSECMISNIVGMVFCGADIGGFFNNPDNELMQRWYQAGAWLPFYRGHATEGSPRREPYLFSTEVQKVIRDAIKLRYKHIPVWYTLFYEHTRYGDPVIRPLFYEYPEYLESENHLLLGSDILVRPVMEANVTKVTVNFPGTETTIWYRVDNDSWLVHNGNSSADIPVDISTSPLFYKGGSIIARKDREKPSTARMQKDPYNLYVNLDSNNSAEGKLYVDDFISFEYSKNSYYLYVQFNYLPDTNGVHIQQIDGNSTGIFVNIHEVIVNGGPNSLHSSRHTKTADGTSLHTINLSEKLSTKEGVILHL